MPWITKARLDRLGARLDVRHGSPEDVGAFVERMACSDNECSELLCAFARSAADHPTDEQVQFDAFCRFIDRVEVVLAQNPSLKRP